MTRNTIVKTALVAALALPLLLTTACGSNTPLDQHTGYARHLDSQLYLRADGQKELRREVQYWAGSRNLKKVTVFYSAGGKQISVYRINGTVQLLTEWYPEPALTVAPPPVEAATPAVFSGPGAGILPGIQTTGSTASPAAVPVSVPAPTTATAPDTTAIPAPVEGAQTAEQAQATAGSAKVYDPPGNFGKVKRSIEYGEDGKTIVKASFFREDGSMSAYGRSVTGGDFELNDYLKDGRTIARQQQFSRAGDVFYMRVVVGAPSNTVVKPIKYGEQTTTFGDNGIRVTRSTKAMYGMTEDIEFFKADGKALKVVVYRGYKIEALYFKADGTVDYFRSFEADGSFTLTKYRDNSGTVKPVNVDGASAREAYRQYWQAKKDADGAVTYELTRHEEIGTDGHMTRQLTFAAGKLTRVEYFNPGRQLARVLTLRGDQTVEKVETYTYPPGGGVATIVTTEVPAVSSSRESYDGRLLELVPFEDVRPLVGPAVPFFNGYGDYYDH